MPKWWIISPTIRFLQNMFFPSVAEMLQGLICCECPAECVFACNVIWLGLLYAHWAWEHERGRGDGPSCWPFPRWTAASPGCCRTSARITETRAEKKSREDASHADAQAGKDKGEKLRSTIRATLDYPGIQREVGFRAHQRTCEPAILGSASPLPPPPLTTLPHLYLLPSFPSCCRRRPRSTYNFHLQLPPLRCCNSLLATNCFFICKLSERHLWMHLQRQWGSKLLGQSLLADISRFNPLKSKLDASFFTLFPKFYHNIKSCTSMREQPWRRRENSSYDALNQEKLLKSYISLTIISQKLAQMWHQHAQHFSKCPQVLQNWNKNNDST